MSGMVPAVVGVVRWRTTPDRVRGMTVIALLVTVALGLVVTVAFGGITGGLRLIGQQSEPEVLATTDLYYRLNDMDAQVANVLLVGGQHGLGIDRQGAQELYEQDRLQADQDLQRAAVVAASVPSAQQTLRSILDGLGRYEALALYRQATGLLQNGILPSARGFTDQNATALDQAYLALRYRRIFNPVLAGQYQQAFEDKSQQLVQLPGAGIYQYDAALARVISAYRANHANVNFGGYLGAEFRNITFPGERVAAGQVQLGLHPVRQRAGHAGRHQPARVHRGDWRGPA